MKTNFIAIYLGGPTVIIEIGWLRIITDPSHDQHKDHLDNVARKLLEERYSLRVAPLEHLI